MNQTAHHPRSQAGITGTTPRNFSTWTVLVVAALMLLVPASGSLIENSTGGLVTYQFDGDSFHDAADTCEDAMSEHLLALGQRSEGWLVPGDDETDHFLLAVAPEDVGQRLRIDVGVAEVGTELLFDAFAPGCAGSVLAEENQPKPAPEDPVPGAGEQLATAKNVDGNYTCSDRWFLNLNQVGKDNEAPATIHVTWTDGSQADVPLQKSTPATAAHYTTTEHPDVTVHSATVVMPDSWTGKLILSEGFCDATDGGAVYGEDARRIGDNIIEFTPIVSGPFVLAVRLGELRDPLAPMAVNCHYCVDGLEGPLDPVLYKLGSASS